MRDSLPKRLLVLVAALGTVGFALTAAMPVAADSDRESGHTLYVAPSGSDANACTKHARCATIAHAVSVAHSGDTVLVAPGTYAGTVAVGTKLDLQATGPGVVIDATGDLNGIGLGVVFVSPTAPPMNLGNASGSEVRGFTIENATQEGIVAVGRDLVISGNTLVHNDLGAFAPAAIGECAAQGQAPGDCGEAIHLGGVTDSRISDNHVTGNAGGILVSDELGPTAWNTITDNVVVNNFSDCGITLAGHNGSALSSTGKRQPRMGGVYDNRITDNTVSGNGAAGIGFFAGGQGTGVYDNLAWGNRIEGNGLPGVAMHTHSLDADANGNHVIANWFSHNGLAPGDPGTPVITTTDIDVVSDPGATPITGTVIEDNHIANVKTGIWLITAGTTDVDGNTFRNVATHIIR